MTGSRRPIRRRPPSPRGGQPDRTQARLVRLCAALGIVLAAFCLKLAFPAQTAAWLSDTLSGGIDLRESVAAIGAGLRDVFTGNSSPDSPVEDGPAENGPALENGPPTEPEPTPAPTQTPEPTPQAPAFPELGTSAAWSLGALTFDEQLLSAAARPVVALEDGIWVTDPEEDDASLEWNGSLEWNDSAAEDASPATDYTRHTLPFDYASPIAVNAVRTSGFGYRLHPIDKVTKFHYGLDIAAPAGTPVLSFAGGRVAAAGKNKSYGNYVLVKHADGYATLYAHLSAITVKSGASVAMGAMIGKVGQTGKATGPHLHFELREGGGASVSVNFIDPAPYV